MVTRLFKSGNSLAVRIPSSIRIGGPGTEVEVAQQGEQVVIRPKRRSLAGVLDRFAAFDKGFMKHGRETGSEPARSW